MVRVSMTLMVSSSRLATSSLLPSRVSAIPRGLQPDSDARDDVVGARRKVLHESGGMGANVSQHARNIDDRDYLRAAARYIDARLVGRNRHAKGLRRIAFQLVERNFDWLAYVGAKQRKRICEGAAVLEMRQRNQVLRMIVGRDTPSRPSREKAT